MSSRSLRDLDGRFRERFESWFAATKSVGLDLLITCTLRSNEEQEALYAKGRTAPGRKVTNAHAGQSAHNFGMALDFVPVVNGKPVWEDSCKDWRVAGDLAQDFDLEWAGNWTTFREYPHIQVPNWKELVHGIQRAA